MKLPLNSIPPLTSASKLPLFAAGLAALVMPSSGAILLSDDFSGLASAGLNGTTPDITVGSTTWVADTQYGADGSALATTTRRAYLTLGSLIDDNRGNAGAIYTLSATLNVSSGTTTRWEAIGFWDEDAPANNFASTPSDGTAWMLRRDNSQIRVFRGPRTASGLTESTASPNNVVGTVDFRISLDLSDWNGTSNFGSVLYEAKLSADSLFTEIASGELDATNSTFRSVGLGGGDANAQISSFELSQIPEPSSLGLLGLAGAISLMRRKR
jgi:hypothetical protein